MMARSRQGLDMTVGSPVKSVVTYAIPVAFAGLLSSLYNTMDSIVVGRFVGSNALAAVGANVQLNMLLMTVIVSLTSAFSVLASQAFGAKKQDLVKKVVVCAVYVVAGGAIVMGLIGLTLARPLMRLINTDPVILDDAAAYLRITVGLCGGELVYNAVTSLLRSVGDSKTPLMFLIITSILNVLLNLLFVLVLKLGVAGVAWATVISQHLSALVAVIYTWIRFPVFRFSMKDMKPDGKIMKETMRLGIMGSLQYIATRIADVIVSARINSYGASTMAAYSTVSQITRYITVAFSSLSGGMSVFTGQNIGAEKPDRIKKSFNKILLLSAGVAVAGFLVMLVFGKTLIGLFITTSDPNYEAVMAESWKCLMIYCAGLPFLAIIFMFTSSLRGLGEATIILISGLVEVVFKLVCALILTRFIGTAGVWLASPVGWFFGIIPCACFYYTWKWVERGNRLKDVQ